MVFLVHRQRGDALHRRLLSFRTVAARSHFLRRESSDELASQQAADPDMQAMAQVWGHPEDLHLYPVRTRTLSTCK